MKWTKEQVGVAAIKALFYITPEGKVLAIDDVDLDGGIFYAIDDDDTGKTYIISFEDVAQLDYPYFQKLSRISLTELKKIMDENVEITSEE